MRLCRGPGRRVAVWVVRCAVGSLPQEMISTLLVELGRQRKEVVRLKGGDPFVFGRGGEEAQALRAAGLSVEVVPGASRRRWLLQGPRGSR